jgi:hypothetical protein
MSGAMYPAILNPMALEPYYSRHVAAMTTERLESKSAIAEQLAYRDWQIAALNDRLAELGSVACDNKWNLVP